MADTITIQTSSSTDVVKIIERGPQGPAGPAGAGASSWNDLTGKPATFPPSTHYHQPEEIFCDAVYVSGSTLSGGELNGVYLRDGSDNGKGIYKQANGGCIFWDDDGAWTLGNYAQTSSFFGSDGDTVYPWDAASEAPWDLGVDGDGDVPTIEQATLEQIQFEQAKDSITTRAPKTGNATADQVVLGSDTRLTNARTPTAHTHAAADITDLATNGNAAALYDEIAGQVGLEVSDYTLKLYGDTGSAEFDTSNLTTGRNILFPNADGTLALNPLTTAGDLFVGGTSGAPARLALGTPSQQLRVNSGATSLEYFTPAAAFDPASPGAIGGTTAAAGTFTTLTANNGTLTASAPVLDLAQTWNNAAVGFAALRLNVTNANSSSNSLLASFEVGSIAQFNVRRDGVTGATGLRHPTNVNTAVLIGGPAEFNASPLAVGSQTGIRLAAATTLAWGPATNHLDPADLVLVRDAAQTLAQRNGTNAQESRLYSTFTSSTNYQRMTIKSVRQTLSALSGASATTTGTFIPDGAVVVGVTTRVSTLLAGATGYTIGDGTDADRWGDITGTAVGTTSDNRDWTAATIECFTAGGNITLTAKTANFTAGAIEISVFYLAGEAD